MRAERSAASVGRERTDRSDEVAHRRVTEAGVLQEMLEEARGVRARGRERDDHVEPGRGDPHLTRRAEARGGDEVGPSRRRVAAASADPLASRDEVYDLVRDCIELGLTIMGLVVFVVVTTVNVVSVVALIHYGRRAAGPRDVLASVLRNPLIVACVLGFAGNALGAELPAVAYETLDVLARASLALGLLCVGAGLELAHLGRARLAAFATAALKLLVFPGATALACRVFGIDALSTAVAVLFTAAPISASSYVLARQLGGDAPMIAGLITITTIAAVATMPLVLALLT